MPESDKELWKLPYYHGLLPREDVIELLQENGEFIVRKSEENAGDKRSYVLSVKHKNVPRHYIFREDKGRIAVDFKYERGYRSVKEFVESHVKKGDSVCAGQKVPIVKAVGKKDWELPHNSIDSGAQLGSGAFGIVRRGFYKRGREPVNVAIKEANLTKCTKEQIKEFMNEARIMRRFNHNNVIRFYGVAVGEEPLMIVMELASNGALKDYLQQVNRSPKSKLYMSLGAAAGLSHIHEKNIIHCDIAARNCLYSENRVKIADFGLARELKKETKITLDKNQRLPIKWLAPETLKERICTRKTDVWSFGILCWEIFENGKPPFQDIANAVVVKKLLQGERLKFDALTPNEFADFITDRVWDGSAARRCSMKDVLDWIDKNIVTMAGGGADSGRNDRSHHATTRRDSRTQKTMKEKSSKDTR